jgi:AcrR family transcriptional regulator
VRRVTAAGSRRPPVPPVGAEVDAVDQVDGIQGETKSVRTRRAIIEAALRLFRERGYDDTTMRAIATEAGVSVGNAYYYFESKEHLVQAFYDRTQEEHRAAARPALDGEQDLTARVVGVLTAWVDVMEPYRAFAGKFFKNAAEPTSPLSPFSAESTPAREASIGLWRQTLEGSDARIPKALRADLPELLWLYSMGIVLFWVHDQSEHADKTRVLVNRTAPLVVRLIGLARLPVLRSTTADLLEMLHEIRSS